MAKEIRQKIGEIASGITGIILLAVMGILVGAVALPIVGLIFLGYFLSSLIEKVFNFIFKLEL